MNESWDDERKKQPAANRGFCPHCGTQRTGDDRFCRSCGRELDAPAAAAGPRPGVAPSSATATQSTAPLSATPGAGSAATIGGLAWIGVAFVSAYLAYLQYQAADYLAFVGTPDASLDTYAIVNVVTAVITLIFAALLISGPTRGRLTASVVWAAISLVSGVVQIAGGATHWTMFASVALALVAGVLSYVARQARSQSIR